MWFIIPVIVLYHHLSKFCSLGPKKMQQEYTKWKRQKYLRSISIWSLQKGNTEMDVYRAEVTFLIPIGEMDFFSLVLLLFCAVLLVTVLFIYFCFKKPAINNILIS